MEANMNKVTQAAVLAADYGMSIEPLRISDERGNPAIVYTSAQLRDAFVSGFATHRLSAYADERITPEVVEAAQWAMNDAESAYYSRDDGDAGDLQAEMVEAALEAAFATLRGEV